MPAAPLHLARRAHELECGVDEVARGCLLGRVYAGAVVFAPPAPGAKATDPVPPPPPLPKGIVIRDSKTMSKAQRERAAAWVHEHAYAVSVVYKDEAYVDAHNILRAAQDAMGDAVRGAQAVVAAKAAAAANPVAASATEPPPPPTRIDRLLVDGHVFAPQPSVGVPALCVIKGDATYFAIACAAIVAKVAHDAYVQALCDAHPTLDAWYDLRRNVGYGTAKHRQGLATHGATPFHRKTFGGCKGVRAAVGWEGGGTIKPPPPQCAAEASLKTPPPQCVVEAGPSLKTPPPQCAAEASLKTPPPQCAAEPSLKTPPPQCAAEAFLKTPPPQCAAEAFLKTPPPQCAAEPSLKTPPPQCAAAAPRAPSCPL